MWDRSVCLSLKILSLQQDGRVLIPKASLVFFIQQNQWSGIASRSSYNFYYNCNATYSKGLWEPFTLLRSVGVDNSVKALGSLYFCKSRLGPTLTRCRFSWIFILYYSLSLKAKLARTLIVRYAHSLFFFYTTQDSLAAIFRIFHILVYYRSEVIIRRQN